MDHEEHMLRASKDALGQEESAAIITVTLLTVSRTLLVSHIAPLVAYRIRCTSVFAR